MRSHSILLSGVRRSSKGVSIALVTNRTLGYRPRQLYLEGPSEFNLLTDVQGSMKNKTWKNLALETSEAARKFLLTEGGVQDSETRGQSEAWRIRLGDTIFTYYNTGTLYFSSRSTDLTEHIVKSLSRIVGSERSESERDFLIDMDETGKGEVLGPSVLAVVVIQSELLSKIDETLGSSDTKKKQKFESWDRLFRELDQYRGHGVSYEIETIPPWDADKFNVNQIMDVVYQRLLSRLLGGLEPSQCRVTLDDYGMGRNLNLYMKSLSTLAVEVKVEAKADENYVEVKTASILSKWRRELAMKKIREKFTLPNASVGSGNAGDPVTLSWLEAWKATGKPWPWFVKTSWKTVRQLDGWGEAPKKSAPPIRHDVLSRESQNKFREGGLSTSSLTIVCPQCGNVLRASKLTPDPAAGLVGRCIGCDEVIQDLGITLRYYCGNALLDSSTIISGAVSKDLEKFGFFAGYTLLLHPMVSAETDSPGGKKEMEHLGDYAAMDRISLKRLEGSSSVASEEHDLLIIRAAKERDAILVTRDKGMYGNAVAQGVFCLAFKT